MHHDFVESPTSPVDDAEFGLSLAASLSFRALQPNLDGLLLNPDRRVAILQPNGWVTAMSRRYTDEFVRPAVPLAARQFLTGIHSPALAAERLKMVRHVAATNTPLAAYQLLNGRRYRLAFVPLGEPADCSVALIACRTRCGDGIDGPKSIASVTCTTGTLGNLSHLSIRELDVLRAMGFGARRDAIASSCRGTLRQLHGTVRNLRRKLQARDGFALSILSIRLGLIDFDDETWGRTLLLRDG